MPGSSTKRLEVKLGNKKSNEYISVFPLNFQFPLVLCSYKALINSTCNSDLYKIYTHSYFPFFQLINYHQSLAWCKSETRISAPATLEPWDQGPETLLKV